MKEVLRKIALVDGRWYRPARFHGCCDCGSIHRVEFKVKQGKLFWRFYADGKKTMAVRKQFKFRYGAVKAAEEQR